MKTAVVSVSLCAVLLAGCGSNADEDSQLEAVKTTSATEPTAMAAVLGSYTTNLGAAPAGLAGNPPGRWGLQLISPRVAFLTDPGGVRFPVGNPMKLSATEVTFAPDPECPTQPGQPMAGTYEWSLQDASLVLTEVQDSCRDRAFVLTSKVWSRTD